jgi:spore maturation protein CgeB
VKILFAGVFKNGSTNISQARCLRECGCEVFEFPYRDMPMDDMHRDLHMVVMADRERCGVVLLSKCNGVDVSVITVLKACGRKVILWYMDPIHNFDAEMIDKVKACDLTVCALQEPYEAARKIIGDKSIFLHEGFDDAVDRPFDVPVVNDVTFIGSLYGDRKHYADEVGFKVIRGVYGEDHAKAVCSSRINLNFTKGGTSDRTYKVLAAGGFLLTESWPGVKDDFTPGLDFVVFEGVSGLRDAIARWLPDEQGRKNISENGIKAVQRFSRTEWAKEIIGRAE